MGVKINYRAYYQNEVFEIRKKASIGILDLGVGLEPVLTSVKWFPEDSAPALNILTDIPTKHIIPMGFKLGSSSSTKRQASSSTKLIRTGQTKLRNGTNSFPVFLIRTV